MREAVERLMAAIARRERIVDPRRLRRRRRHAHDHAAAGASSCSGGDVEHFVPDRLRDGYGLQPATVERLHAAGARVIVSVDCGIRGG